jgi:hypothetical protein
MPRRAASHVCLDHAFLSRARTVPRGAGCCCRPEGGVRPSVGDRADGAEGEEPCRGEDEDEHGVSVTTPTDIWRLDEPAITLMFAALSGPARLVRGWRGGGRVGGGAGRAVGERTPSRSDGTLTASNPPAHGYTGPPILE